VQDADAQGDGGDDGREARLEARRKRLRRLRPILLVVGVVLTALNVWVCADREQQKDRASEQRGLSRYLTTSYRELHKQTESVLSGLAGLVDETAPSAHGAVDIVDREIVPSLDWVIEQGRVVVPEGEAARGLHSEYLGVLAAARADAGRMRAIFAEPAAEISEQRRRATAVLIETRTRFEAFYQHVVEVGARTGLAITPAPDAGPGAPK